MCCKKMNHVANAASIMADSMPSQPSPLGSSGGGVAKVKVRGNSSDRQGYDKMILEKRGPVLPGMKTGRGVVVVVVVDVMVIVEGDGWQVHKGFPSGTTPSPSYESIMGKEYGKEGKTCSSSV
jgi:hypothetical protein